MSTIQNYALLKELKPWKFSWCIKVKILHSWNHYAKATGGTFEMVLADETGDKIQAGIKKEHLPKFQKLIAKGEWKVIKGFNLTESKGQYRSTNHPFKIQFQYTTDVTNTTSTSDDIWLDLLNFTDILNGSLDQNILVDVIGQISEIGEIKTVDVQGRPTKKIDFNLRDLNNNYLPCTLWGRFVEEIEKTKIECEENIVICVIRWAKLGLYRAKRSISNAFDASELLINPHVKEVQEFISLLSKDVSLSLSETTSKNNIITVKTDYSIQYARKTIAEIITSLEVEKVRVLCTILAIDTDWPWYYVSCRKCNKRVNRINNLDEIGGSNQLYWCDTCTKEVTSVIARYWLHLHVMDSTGECKVMLFDSHAHQMVGQTASDLLNGSYDEIEDPETLTDAVKHIVGKTFQFVLCVENDAIYYKVAKVLPNNLDDYNPKSDSELQLSQSTNYSTNQVLEATESVEKSNTAMSSTSTPTSKRKGISISEPDQSLIKKEKGVDAIEEDPSNQKKLLKIIKIEK